jgi:hypothetical protein
VKFYQVVVLVVASITFLFLGSFLFGIGFHLYAKEDFIEDLTLMYDEQFLMMILGIFFVILGYYASVKYLIKGLFREDGMLFYGAENENAISYAAIEDLVKKTVVRFQDVRKCRVKVKTLKKKVQVWVTVQMWIGMSVNDSVSQIRTELRNKFNSILGSDEHLEFMIRVLGVEERKQQELQLSSPLPTVQRRMKQ